MSNRHRSLERLQARARAQIPGAAVKWLAAARTPLEKLTKAALSGSVTDAEFRAMVEKFAKDLPGLLDKLDHAAIAEPLEHAMGAALANGIAARTQTPESRDQTRKAKLPWETDAYLAAQKREANGQFGEGDGNPSRKKQRRKPTRKEKIEADKQAASEPDESTRAAIERYRKGVIVKSPTGRDVEFGDIAAGHLAKKEGARARFADLAEKTVAQPDAVWNDGLRNRFIKAPRPGGRNSFLVVTTQVSESRESVLTFTKQTPGKKDPPGRRIYPAE